MGGLIICGRSPNVTTGGANQSPNITTGGANQSPNITTGGAMTMTVEERARPAIEFKPEVASLNMVIKSSMIGR